MLCKLWDDFWMIFAMDLFTRYCITEMKVYFCSTFITKYADSITSQKR